MAAHRRAFGVRPVLRWAVRYANNFFIFLEGLGNFPTSKIPVRRGSVATGIYGSGYPLPMLAIQLFLLRQFNAVVDIFPACISQYDSSVVGFARLWGIELFHIYFAGL